MQVVVYMSYVHILGAGPGAAVASSGLPSLSSSDKLSLSARGCTHASQSCVNAYACVCERVHVYVYMHLCHVRMCMRAYACLCVYTPMYPCTLVCIQYTEIPSTGVWKLPVCLFFLSLEFLLTSKGPRLKKGGAQTGGGATHAAHC